MLNDIRRLYVFIFFLDGLHLSVLNIERIDGKAPRLRFLGLAEDKVGGDRFIQEFTFLVNFRF